MSEKSSSNRWIPFQCPSCFGLFRVRKNQVGRKGYCPTCRVVVATVGNASAVEPDPEELLEESKRALFENVAVAREMTPEEREAEELAKQNRKKRYVGGDQGNSGWQDQEGKSAAGFPGRFG